jgi:hypothetical protein
MPRPINGLEPAAPWRREVTGKYQRSGDLSISRGLDREEVMTDDDGWFFLTKLGT